MNGHTQGRFNFSFRSLLFLSPSQTPPPADWQLILRRRLLPDQWESRLESEALMRVVELRHSRVWAIGLLPLSDIFFSVACRLSKVNGWPPSGGRNQHNVLTMRCCADGVVEGTDNLSPIRARQREGTPATTKRAN